MLLKKLLLFINLILVFELILSSCPPSAQNALNNRCLQFINHSTTFETAEFMCNLMDGQLVAVHSVFDNKLLVQLAGKQFQNVNGWWLGGNLTQNGWQWVDGSKFDYNNWESGEPLYGNSLIQLPVVGQWKSVNGNNTYPFICEIPQINTAIPPTKCDDQWLYDADTKKCFFVATNFYQFLTWDDTRALCMALGGDLPHIHNQAENDAFLRLANRHTWYEFYLGLWNPNLDGNWTWVDDGSSPTFTNWCAGNGENGFPPLNTQYFADFYNWDFSNCNVGQWFGGIFQEPLSICAKNPNF